MKNIIKVLCIVLIAMVITVQAAEPTFMQYLYSAKQVLPDAKKIAVFTSQEKFDSDKDALNKAGQRTGLAVKVFVISDMKSIGSNIKMLSDEDVILVTNVSVLMNKSSKLFILSKCKDKKMPIISASEDYTQSGALIGLLKGDDGRSKIVLNIKHSPYLASRFTDEFNQKAGVKELIQ